MVVFPLVFCNLHVDTLKVKIFGKGLKRRCVSHTAVQDKYFQATGYMDDCKFDDHWRPVLRQLR